MADALIFEFGADVTKFNASIGEVTAEIKKLKDVLKTATGAEIPKLNAEISALQTSLGNLKSVGTPAAAAFTKVEDSAKGARIALTNVSQIAQDLPFGFIGIQNNIPGLVQSFTKLSGESGGAVAALKAMGSALIGPAGIFLAFSIVTSAATALISKYGSLGAAFDAFFSKSNKLTKQILDTTKAYDEYNKSLRTNGQLVAEATGSVDAQITKAKFLQKEIENLTYSDEYRKLALQELIKLDRTRFENFDIEKGKLDGLSGAVDNYTESILRNAVAKIYENKLAESAVSLNTQRDLLAEIAKGYDEVGKRRKEQALEGPLFDPLTGAEIPKPAILTKDLDKQFQTQKKIVDEAIKQYDKLKQSYTDAFEAALQFTNLEPPKPEKELKAPKAAKEKKGLDILDLERRARIAAQKLQEQADRNRLKFLNEQLKAEAKLTKEFEKRQEAQTNADAKAFSKVNFKKLADGLNPILDELNNLEVGAQRAATLIEDTFFSPLNEAFETLFTKGTFAIKDFTRAILNSIAQIAAKLAASAIVNTLISLFASDFGGALSDSGSLRALGGAIGGTRAGAANFGGVQGGGFGMSGSVNMVLRGTDLVGSINRTNSQISRVG